MGMRSKCPCLLRQLQGFYPPKRPSPPCLNRTPISPSSAKPLISSLPQVNWLKAGILSADKVLTVSPNYATEIMSGEDKGVELHEFLAAKGVEGIVNGMDVEEWDPAAGVWRRDEWDGGEEEWEPAAGWWGGEEGRGGHCKGTFMSRIRQ